MSTISEIERWLIHFSHPHELFPQNHNTKSKCKACTLPISGSDYYGCYLCEFNIHISCAEFPQQLEQHPIHPQHTLTLLTQPPDNNTVVCNVCGFICEGFIFHCPDCDFDMDLRCAGMMPIKNSILKNWRHPHPLLICDINNNTTTCRCCWQPIITVDPVLVCLECHAIMHESCAGFPREMVQHILHPQHPLIFTLDSDVNVHCDACGKSNFYGSFFRCVQCDFVLEVSCASLTPTTSNEMDDNVSTHIHPLIECYKKTKSLRPLVCSGCMELFKEDESIYVCLPCKQLLHKSCAHSPRQIMDHPFHPAHPLNLFDETPSKWEQMWRSYSCPVCKKSYFKETSHFYGCYKCDFYLHTKCAFPIAPLLNSQAVLHQHPLAFLDIKEALPCNACNLLCHYPFFRCVDCDFNLHVHCLSGLPPTVKHKCHRHPLTLTHSPVKDYEDEDDDAEFYCDACEKYRLLNEPTYYCVESHYVAHVHCVISEVFPYLERGFESLGDKFDKMKLDITLDVVEDIAGPELQRDAKEEKVEEVEGAFIGAETENDLFTARADDSSAEVVKELVDIAGEALLAELDAEIIEQTIKLDQLNKRRAQYISFLQK